MGAVLFGHDRLIYKSRISRATYGVRTNVLFDDKKHDQTKKWLNNEDGKYYCNDVFDLHVKKGQSVVLNELTIGKTYLPMYKHQKQLTLQLFKSVSDGHEDGTVMVVRKL
ncbi:hypothetical protein DPMN_097503 [Dreissena polymorpha]|uniref:Uncharacterized protein n=1 Tax=Dreissena polymorpha TaxID=45954 RepID=A0A9D4LBW8_DREPO|nr:hypothetical protein DPMN_097503 [Dreissena polymorpha]